MKEETILKKEWINRYGLTAISTYKFYKIVGCFIMGFEFIRTQGKIQPHFVIYPLWKESIKKCFSTPYILYCIEDERGFNYQLALSEILENLDMIFDNVDKYLGFRLDIDIKSQDILKLINKVINQPISIKNSRVRGLLSELKIHLAAYLENPELQKHATVEIDDMLNYLDMDIFRRRFGHPEEWKNNLISVFSNRQALLDKIEENISNGKINARTELLP